MGEGHSPLSRTQVDGWSSRESPTRPWPKILARETSIGGALKIDKFEFINQTTWQRLIGLLNEEIQRVENNL